MGIPTSIRMCTLRRRKKKATKACFNETEALKKGLCGFLFFILKEEIL